MTINLYIPILVSFLISLFFIPYWIRKSKEIGLMWPDMNRYSKDKVAGSGGIAPILGFVISILIFIAYRTFVLRTDDFLVEILSMLSVVLLLSGYGLVDDLLGWRKGGLSRRSRYILVALASIPLIVINAGKSDILLPIIGNVDLGLFYLIAIPIGITGAAFTFNNLAGFNGLEAGQGILILSAFGIVSYFTGNSWLTIIAFCMVAALLAFLFYNFYPAKVFPGDSLTYAVGGLAGAIAILGNFEKIGVFFFIPFIFETLLKLRGGLKKQSFGKPNKDGTLGLRYEKLYSLNHIAIFLLMKLGMNPTQKKVVYAIWILQIIVIILGFIIFREGVF